MSIGLRLTSSTRFTETAKGIRKVETIVSTGAWLAALLLLAVAATLFISMRRLRARNLILQGEVASLLRAEAFLKEQAYFDSLTGLANRLLLSDRTRGVIERSKRNQATFALLMVDLNNFKAINDTFGHAAGDQVLITVARRLVGAVRASDTVARLGGDEFVLIIESIDDPRELIQLGRKLIDTLSEVITLDSGVNVHIGASVGFAVYPKDGLEIGDLLHVADKGMYDCKVSGLMELQ
jgi:diguanylate cyclase (GGDEF)-like protein